MALADVLPPAAMPSPRTLALGSLIAASLAASTSLDAKPKPEPEPVLPAPDVSVSVQAPDGDGPWIVRLKNNHTESLRVRADARLLRLLVAPVGKSYVECSLPAAMREGADPRELELGPGETWSEQFDPRAFCFGKVIDELGPGSSVTAFFGFAPAKGVKTQKKPFVIEPIVAPATFASLKRIVSLTTWVPYRLPIVVPPGVAGTEGKPGEAKPPESKPEQAPKPTLINTSRIVLETPRLIDAANLRDARISATVSNKGDRDALMHVRADALEFSIKTPDGKTVECGGGASGRAAVRDFFHTLRPKGAETLTVLLAEVCDRTIFQRPGIYEIRTKLRATEDGSRFELRALTGVFEADKSTLLRLQDAKQPYYVTPAEVESSPNR